MTKEVLDKKVSELNSKIEQNNDTNSQATNNFKKTKKINSIIQFTVPALLIFLFFFTAVLHNNENEILNGILIIFFVISLIAGLVFYGASYIIFGHKEKQLIQLVRKLEENNKEIYSQLYELKLTYLSELFNTTKSQIIFDLEDIVKTHSTLFNWYQTNESTDVVIKALQEKYKMHTNKLITSDLQVENLKLQNEGIAIDNSQKKFWTCQFCGNMNRADEMSCIKCGGIRPSLE